VMTLLHQEAGELGGFICRDAAADCEEDFHGLREGTLPDGRGSVRD
jgi:hypothetical protein